MLQIRCQPCAAFTGKHTAGEETDSQLLSHCREDVSKNKAENITYNQPAQYVRNEIDSPQSTFPFNLTVQSKSQIRLTTLVSMVLTMANLKVNR